MGVYLIVIGLVQNLEFAGPSRSAGQAEGTSPDLAHDGTALKLLAGGDAMIDVSPSLALLVLVGVMVGCGTVLVLERSLSRIVIGASLITYGVNVMVLMAGGRAGGPPIIGQTEVADMADPLPQAMVLTAIVIGLALTAFMLTMAPHLAAQRQR